jgi:predicted dehydrogenase
MINVAIFGTGDAARHHISEIKRHPAFNAVYVYSRDNARARAIGEDHGIQPTSDMEKVLHDSNIDAVDICTANHLHYKYALESLGADKHVILEKPATFKVSELMKLCKTAEIKKKVFLINFQKKLGATYQRILKEYREKKYGELIYASTTAVFPRKRNYFNERRSDIQISGGGVLIYNAIHELDMIINLFGKVRSVHGTMYNLSHDMEVEDTAEVTLVFEKGGIYHLFATLSDKVGAMLFRGKNFIIENDLFFENKKISFSEFTYEKHHEKSIRIPKLENAMFTFSFNEQPLFDRGTYYKVLDELIRSIKDPDYLSPVRAETSIETHRVIEEFYNVHRYRKTKS